MPTLTISETPIATATGKTRTARTNEFLAVIESLNDGKTRLMTPDAGENLGTMLNDLRKAAKTINRSVSINWLDKDATVLSGVKGNKVPAGATSFRFVLRDLITRTAKDKNGTEVATAPAAPVAEAPKATAKGKAK